MGCEEYLIVGIWEYAREEAKEQEGKEGEEGGKKSFSGQERGAKNIMKLKKREKTIRKS